MSFRSFIYYCALCGGWAAFVGWFLGRTLAQRQVIATAGLQGMYLGMLIALALGFVDALLNFSVRQAFRAVPRLLAGLIVGTFGGLLGGMIGQSLVVLVPLAVLQKVFLIFGWTITGLLVGASLGAFELLYRFVLRQDNRGARRKILRSGLGGFVGGLLGGIIYLLLQGIWAALFGKKLEDPLSPGAIGFVALGLCIGLMIGLAQVIFKEAWVRVEAGFRAGRELILSKPEVTLGRAESCDIGLFGDNAVERLHARIVQQGNNYLLVDAGSGSGTYVNDARVLQPTPLRSGDTIRLGRNVLRFGERQKK